MQVIDSSDPSAVGARVRALREAMGFSLRDLADHSGVSAPMLSQVERGETSPTLQIAGKIANGLDLKLSQLLRLDEQDPVSIVRAGAGHGGGAGGHRYEVMTPPLPGQRVEVSRHVLEPKASTGTKGDSALHEAGSRETAYVEAGEVGFFCDGEEYALAAGDCVTFDSDLPHHFENSGTKQARLLAVVSAGLRRS